MKKHQKQNGYILLLTVLISSVILLMALGLANVAFREQTFSIQAKDSRYAFFASDTGMECALFWDRSGNIDYSQSTIEMKCANQTIYATPTLGSQGEKIYAFNLPLHGITIGSGCAQVTIIKGVPIDTDVFGTKVESKGYNLSCQRVYDILLNGNGIQNTGRLVERALRAVYIDEGFTGQGSGSGQQQGGGGQQQGGGGQQQGGGGGQQQGGGGQQQGGGGGQQQGGSGQTGGGGTPPSIPGASGDTDDGEAPGDVAQDLGVGPGWSKVPPKDQ